MSSTFRTEIAARIRSLTGGNIPSITLLEDLIRLAPEFDRDVTYVLDQCQNLKLGRVGLGKLHEACGLDSRRALKALLAYEFDFVDGDTFRDAVAATEEAVFYGLENLVNAAMDAEHVREHFASLNV